MKKALALLLAVVMVACLFAGCAEKTPAPTEDPNGTNQQATDQKTTDQPATEPAASDVVIEFQQWFDNEMEAGYMQSLCDEFYAQTGVTVKLLSNPYADTKTQLEASAVAGTMADIVALDGGWIYDYATQGHLADLGALFNEIGFDSTKVSMQTAVNGTVVAQPLVIFPCLMAVNLDLLDAAGVAEIPQDWTSFLDACEKVTALGNAYGFAMNMSTDNATCMEYFTAFAWNSGCSVLTSDGKPFMADNQILTDTCVFFKSLFDNEVVVPGMYTMTDADKVQEFVNGRVAFMPDSVAHLNNIREQNPDMNLTYANLPHQDGYTGDSYIRANNWACGISANSEHQKEAAQFIAFLLGNDVNADLCIHAGGFAVNTEANPAYTDDSDAFKAITEIYSTSHGMAEYYSMPTAEALMKVLDENLVMYIDGDFATPEEMLQDVQEKFDAAYQ